MTVTEIRSILEAPYNRTVWKDFIKTQFTNNQLTKDDYTLQLGKSDLYTECYSLGNYAVDDFTKIGIFEIQLAPKVNLSRNRVALRNLIKEVSAQVAGAMVVFVQGDKWRFSYISKRKVKNKNTNLIEDKETAPKRFTYLFGKGEKARTASDRFEKLINKQQQNIFQLLSLNDFEEAFSVEALSKDFFKKYKDTYEDFVEYLTGKRYKKQGNKFVEQPVSEPNNQLKELFKSSEPEREARDFCKRMMGRIVFLYFIQKKGWLAVPQGKNWGEGNMNYLYDLFKNSNNDDNFYSKELVPLFFTTLNNFNSENEDRILRFPYLNGGLFDNTIDEKYNELKLPKIIFEKLFKYFNDFNFTIHEDAPDEQTVAVDPEMLGHIFENLLEDNKDKGAFYTPKEIVHYMCQESLKEHIVTNYDISKRNVIDKLMQQTELLQSEENWIKQNAHDLIGILKNVKICDPAIGSGAFPMGILQEVFNLMVILHNYEGWGKKNEAEIKKHIIQESIYGVDIDAGAVDIARLRFWLSLIVDEEKPQPLPNLDFKIMRGNSLLNIPPNSVFNVDEAEELEVLKDEYFSTKDSKVKKDLKEKINKTTHKILKLANQFSPYLIDFDFELFFSEVYHGKNKGFDIVIGNPPYDVYEGKKSKEIEIFNKHPDYQITKGGKLNAYKLFLAKSVLLLKKDGIMCEIFQNSFLADNSASKLRKYFIDEQHIIKIDSYPERDNIHTRVFESAKMSVCIMLSRNTKLPTYSFQVNNWRDKSNIKNTIIFSKEDIYRFDKKNLIIPNIEYQELEIILKIKESKFNLLSDFAKCIEGELNMTFHKSYFTSNSNFPKIIKGAQVQRYFITDTPSQGEIQYLDLDMYLKDYGTTIKSTHYKKERIALQGITGANDKTRLVMTMLNDGNFCANSCNYIIIKDEFSNEVEIKYLLALTNSSLINWMFRKTSTNSNVNCYEIDGLPIRLINSEFQISFVILVDYLLFLKNKLKIQILDHTTNERLASNIEEVLNMMVYELYFEEHMKQNDLDVLQFIQPKPIDNLHNDTDKVEVIKNFYLWLQTADNKVRQRINSIDIKSPDILSVINSATK
ncbi:site-specific DNA-methyltransferase (adenine-specific) [Flavobacterium branchiophilum]|uniref:site-specific DNA-methyltransferase (adenine-specific) n=1 Tax=Flavobacterium branchiophilum (strain FL-15) TaxID=1034807 RepID=G2Z3U2_FLABF|nr:Eco57I restriction-modification methylase domain-containing protein [Flavobacterium branchiophilum]CCB68273.1 Probable type II endonuclease-methyltransferase fusion protein [Flavobacterium branchiophilum FL-15]